MDGVSAVGGSLAPLNWIQIILWAVATPGAAAIGIVVWRVWTWYFGRRDIQKLDSKVAALTIEEQLRADIRENSARTDQRTDRLFERYAKAVDDKDEENVGLKSDLERWEALARRWYWLYRDLVPNYRNAISIAQALARRLMQAGLLREDEWPQFAPPPTTVPDLEDPTPRTPEP